MTGVWSGWLRALVADICARFPTSTLTARSLDSASPRPTDKLAFSSNAEIGQKWLETKSQRVSVLILPPPSSLRSAYISFLPCVQCIKQTEKVVCISNMMLYFKRTYLCNRSLRCQSKHLLDHYKYYNERIGSVFF